ncbi:MAG: enoyl-CoA hydratase [Methylobacteriaceae bacterium]|nr:enoyl-CoA hydratase [Methylobacteriaceae bacterium]
MTQDILYELRDRIAYVTLNRPQARNALTFDMYEALFETAGRISSDAKIAAVVISGAGEKAFAAGTDISEFRSIKTPEDALAYERRIDRVLGALETCPKPIIAAISGACTGGGAAIAACCDLRIATTDLRFGFPVARTLGNCLSMGNYARLNTLIGPSRAKDLIFNARLMGAEEAKSTGFISEILGDKAALMQRAEELAVTVAGHAPLTLRATKEAFRRLAAQAPSGDDLITMCYMSEDFREGMSAFLEKRRPNWQGR